MILEMSLSQTVQHWCKVICRSQIKTDFKKSIVAQSRLYSSICLMGWRKAWELQTRRRFEPPHYRGLDPHTRIHLNVKDCGENYNVAICLYLLSQGKHIGLQKFNFNFVMKDYGRGWKLIDQGMLTRTGTAKWNQISRLCVCVCVCVCVCW